MSFALTGADFARGALAGLVVCIPPGPMTTLCVSRSVRHGFVGGFATAAGSALGDATYVAVAAFGVATLRGSLGAVPRVVACLAAPLLLWMGIRALSRARRADGGVAEEITAVPPRPVAAAATGYAMALGTPGTLPALVALFAALGSTADGDVASTVTTTAGALLAATGWWIGVTALSCKYRLVIARYVHVVEITGGAFLVLAALAAIHVAISGA